MNDQSEAVKLLTSPGEFKSLMARRAEGSASLNAGGVRDPSVAVKRAPALEDGTFSTIVRVSSDSRSGHNSSKIKLTRLCNRRWI